MFEFSLHTMITKASFSVWWPDQNSEGSFLDKDTFLKDWKCGQKYISTEDMAQYAVDLTKSGIYN